MFMKYYSVAAVLAQLLATSNGHMIMQTPKPFGGPDLDNSPLTAGNFPCKLKGDPATFYSTSGLDNTMAVGESQSLSFKGSAVHGGGSCQLAITKDLQPSASTSWQVILSIEGGCPSKSGQGPDTYDFKIPDGVAPGKYVFAWTWISKLAGQPEYYMNCAPITVTGGKTKRSDNETMELFPRDGQFPELFVGNLADINSCKTEPSTDPQYPDPGPNVIRPGSNNNFAKIQGDNCVPKGAKSGGTSGGAAPAGPNTPNSGENGGGNGSGSGSVGSSAAAPSSSATPVTSAAPGDSFVTVVPVGSSSAAATQSSLAAPVVSSLVSSPVSSAATSVATPIVSSAVSSATPAPVSTASPAGSASPSSGSSSGGLTGPCTTEGMFNCIGGTAYQQCASGSWSTVMQMAPTVKCAEGQTMTLWARGETTRRIARRVNW
ncbi:hypothetical protein F4813DRAFT_395964 [Daldinia decipiens]|uniref:uncharacterized protein n=1 Tax=Daldinia decipiens TaxID=326647 RepID=UPI0020C45212|nr:uncharacterized protein F4813DRAFT_395964 [Daldinia decipiens]KAI1658273.1 hypothetical protein F4813DRAFT_395964 [Daldinia decipiens]